MTATLTPAEAEEVTRFGIHDPEIIEDLEKHFDDELACSREDAPAAVRMILRCCKKVVLLCETHYAKEVAGVNDYLSVMAMDCKFCGHVYRPPRTFEDVAKVVSL